MCTRPVNRKSKQIIIINHFYSHDNWKKCMRDNLCTGHCLSFSSMFTYKTSSAVPESCTHHLNMNKLYYRVFLSLFISLLSLVTSSLNLLDTMQEYDIKVESRDNGRKQNKKRCQMLKKYNKLEEVYTCEMNCVLDIV